MARLTDWLGREIEVARSSGGVLVTADPFDNLIRTGITPWPPAEIVQKLYQSRQVRAFRDAELATATHRLGFYSDLQSLHSEDAITWSVFGPLVHAPADVRIRFARALLSLVEVPAGPISTAILWLWRRVPHPDTLVPGGPEVDFGIQTDDAFVLGEAKWRSPVGKNQGVHRDKDQVALRREFCASYGPRLLPACRHFVVLSLAGGLLEAGSAEVGGVHLHSRDTTWAAAVALKEHPLASELQAYLGWKLRYSKGHGDAAVPAILGSS